MNHHLLKLLSVLSICIGGIGLIVSASSIDTSLSIDHITRGYNRGITKYETLQTFKPTHQLTREQAVKMIVSRIRSNPAIHLSGSTTTCPDFQDQGLIDQSLQQAIQRSCEYGIIQGHQGLMMPQAMITSSDLTTIITRVASIINITPSDTQRGYYPTRAQLLTYLYRLDLEITKQAEIIKTQQLQQDQLQLDQAKLTRSKAGISNYQLTQQISCFCIEEYTKPISYKVHSNTIVSGSAFYENSSGLALSGDQYERLLTVTQAFDKIQEAITSKADSITVHYDSKLGYPTQITIDRSYMIADEEQYYSFTLTQ